METRTLYIAAKTDNLEKAKTAIEDPNLILEAVISANDKIIRNFIKNKLENQQISTPWIMLQITIRKGGEIDVEKINV